jgi:hypothetical protein
METKMWSDTWFQELPVKLKALWLYLFSSCDEAGIWKVNKRLAEFQIGEKFDWDKVPEILNSGKERVLLKGDIWILRDFVSFQYGEKIFTSEHPFHKKLREKIQKADDTLSDTLCDRVSPTLQVKEKEKAKELYINISIKEKEDHFSTLWAKYPIKNRQGKKEARKRYLGSVKTDSDRRSIEKALDLYLNSEQVKKGFVRRGSKWFDEWTDWTDYEEKTIKNGGKNESDGESPTRSGFAEKYAAY